MKFESATTTTDSLFDETVTAKSITQSILDKGSVLVYLQDGSGSYAEASALGFFVVLSVGQIYISTSFTVPSSWKFRYVVIPGTVSTQSRSSHLSYADASKLFNLSN